ncbi:MAG: M20/M25/M40 family metallo-hydrolase [bacterium]
MDRVFKYIDDNSAKFVRDLQILLRQPSISAQDIGLTECADLLVRLMNKSGVPSRAVPATEGPPVVFGELVSPGSDRVLLCAGHYDVQPPDPLEEWISDPFDAEIIDDVIYARGVGDNKSGIMAFVQAAEAFLRVRGQPPVNLKFVYVGEEEIGDPHLEQWVIANTDLLKADGMVNLDGGIDSATHSPRLLSTVRSLLYLELTAKGPTRDVHSGMSTMVTNPAWRLVHALGTMMNKEREITIPDWNDELLPPTSAEDEYLKEAADRFEAQSVRNALGIEEFPPGQTPYDILTDRHFKPTCNICGFEAGYTGPGSKTIVPRDAVVKLDFRLPANLEPEKQVEKLRRHLDKHGFQDVEIRVHTLKKIPWKVRLDDDVIQATVRAGEKVFGRRPVPLSVTSPAALRTALFELHMDVPFAITGFGPPGGNLHAPNEYMPISYYIRGIKYAAAIMQEFANETR